MDVSQLLLTGSLSGLISVLAHSVIGSAVEVLRGPLPAAPGATLRISEALLHMLSGAGLALLFWLSWGMAAVVDVPWWLRGGWFGGLCWLALALPGTLNLAMSRMVTVGVAAALALRWGTTCLITGLACAWSWRNGAM
jgi:hypothetical protein